MTFSCQLQSKEYDGGTHKHDIMFLGSAICLNLPSSAQFRLTNKHLTNNFIFLLIVNVPKKNKMTNALFSVNV